MAGIWDTIKNALGGAGNAWQETQKNMYTAPTTPKPAATPKPVTSPAPSTGYKAPGLNTPGLNVENPAQAYAQAALNGTSGVYVPANQTVNAMINAQTPINTVTVGGGSSGGTGGGSSGGGAVATGMDDIYNLYAQAQAQQNALYRQQDALYKQQEELAAKQRDDLKATLLEQNELAKKQREAALNASLDANNKAADKSLKDAYIRYMLLNKNMPQRLKALGISGGQSETTQADANNTYMNNRFGIEDGRNDANALARRDFDSGVNEDYIDYLAALADVDNDYTNRMYDINTQKNNTLIERQQAALDYAQALAGSISGAKSGAKSSGTKSSGSSSGGGVAGVRIGNNQTVHTSGESLLNELYGLGFTEAQAREYLKNAGIM